MNITMFHTRKSFPLMHVFKCRDQAGMTPTAGQALKSAQNQTIIHKWSGV